MIPTSIDGTDITGATIDGTDVQEITVDGDTVFTAGPTIPDSAIHQYLKTDFTTSNWPDSEGSSDINTVSGLSFDSTAFNGDGGVSGDGTNDHGTSDTMGTFGSDLSSNFAISIPYSTTDVNGYFLGTGGGGGAGLLVAYSLHFASTVNEFCLFLADDNSDQWRIDSTVSTNDGNPHHAIIQKTGPNAADVEIYIDDMSSDVSVVKQDRGFDDSNTSNFQHDMAYFAGNSGGNIERHINADMGTVRWFGSSLSESERQDVHNILGWT